MTRNGSTQYQFSLAEARVLYELGAYGASETGDLSAALAIDAGQLSRVLKRLEDRGLMRPCPRPPMRAASRSQLTPEGEDAYARSTRTPREEVAALLDALPRPGRARSPRCASSTRRIEPDNTVVIRGLQPGDLGWLVERHGVLYAREYGWDESFERLVAGSPRSTTRTTTAH